jgi:hypothetical protein
MHTKKKPLTLTRQESRVGAMSDSLHELFTGANRNSSPEPVVPPRDAPPEQTPKLKVRKQRKRTNKEWDEFSELLCAQCLVRGGRISDNKLRSMKVKELFDMCLPNGIIISSTIKHD